MSLCIEKCSFRWAWIPLFWPFWLPYPFYKTRNMERNIVPRPTGTRYLCVGFTHFIQPIQCFGAHMLGLLQRERAIIFPVRWKHFPLFPFSLFAENISLCCDFPTKTLISDYFFLWTRVSGTVLIFFHHRQVMIHPHIQHTIHMQALPPLNTQKTLFTPLGWACLLFCSLGKSVVWVKGENQRIISRDFGGLGGITCWWRAELGWGR